jgi:predicted ribosomally synthesized peptide with nif11-like leader
MAVLDIKTFSNQAKADPQLTEKLRACQKVRDLLKLAKECGHHLDEVDLYPPNEPQFTADQLSPKLVDALLRA